MVNEKEDTPNIYQRVIDTLNGKKPGRIPFIDRLELWYTSHSRAETLPDEFKNPLMSLTEVHRAVGIGQELMVPAFSRKLWRVELNITWNGRSYYREKDPILEDFPRINDIIPMDKPGTTKAEFITPLGKLTTQDRLLPNMVAQEHVKRIVLKPATSGH